MRKKKCLVRKKKRLVRQPPRKGCARCREYEMEWNRMQSVLYEIIAVIRAEHVGVDAFGRALSEIYKNIDTLLRNTVQARGSEQFQIHLLEEQIGIRERAQRTRKAKEEEEVASA